VLWYVHPDSTRDIQVIVMTAICPRFLGVWRQAVREILTDDAFVKPPSYSDLAAVLGQGLVTSSGPKHAGWSTQKRVISMIPMPNVYDEGRAATDDYVMIHILSGVTPMFVVSVFAQPIVPP
jgi:hypothetical protein